MGLRVGDKLGKMGISRYFQMRINIYLVQILPFAVMQSLINLLGRIYYFFNRIENQQIRENVRLALGGRLNELAVRKTIKHAFNGIFAHYLEKLFVAFPSFKRTCRFLNSRVSLVGQGVLDNALKRGKGVILVTGHYGAVEFLPLALALNGYTVTMLLRFKTKRLKESLIRRSDGVPITLIDVDEGRGALFEALKALKQNQIVITECDEFDKWRPCKHRCNQFLGRKVPYDRTLDMLKRRSKAEAVMGIVQRQPKGRYTLGLHALSQNGNETNKTAIPQQVLTVLE